MKKVESFEYIYHDHLREFLRQYSRSTIKSLEIIQRTLERRMDDKHVYFAFAA